MVSMRVNLLFTISNGFIPKKNYKTTNAGNQLVD